MCFFGTCRRPVSLVADACKFCNAKFCNNHSYVIFSLFFYHFSYFCLTEWLKFMDVVKKLEMLLGEIG